MTKNTWAPALLIAGAIAVVGCGNATPTVQGGDPLTADPCAPGGGNSGNRWQDLYACYFGPTGVVSCGGMSDCHSAAGQRGVTASGGFMCPQTSDPKPCWRGMTGSPGIVSVPLDGSTINPASTTLYNVLCKSVPMVGLMPKSCPHRLEPVDLARISAWIQAGAPNN